MKIYPVLWTKVAKKDVVDLKRFISNDSPWYAKSISSDIVMAAKDIGFHPRRFTICVEWKSPLTRHRVVHGYRIIYDIKPSSILIVGVIHEKRMPENLEDKRFSAT